MSEDWTELMFEVTKGRGAVFTFPWLPGVRIRENDAGIFVDAWNTALCAPIGAVQPATGGRWKAMVYRRVRRGDHVLDLVGESFGRLEDAIREVVRARRIP